MSNLFKKLEKEASAAGIELRTREAGEWFRKRAREIHALNRQDLMRDKRLTKLSKTDNPIGSMIMFFYDPKTKEQLPYFDKFPITIVVGPAPGGFHGLNLHYIPPALRVTLLDNLLEITNNKRYDETTKFKATYSLLSSANKFRYFRPCFKHYLNDHVQSNFAMVSPMDWEIAAFLPTASWSKASNSSVWRDSRKMINGNNR